MRRARCGSWRRCGWRRSSGTRGRRRWSSPDWRSRARRAGRDESLLVLQRQCAAIRERTDRRGRLRGRGSARRVRGGDDAREERRDLDAGIGRRCRLLDRLLPRLDRCLARLGHGRDLSRRWRRGLPRHLDSRRRWFGRRRLIRRCGLCRRIARLRKRDKELTRAERLSDKASYALARRARPDWSWPLQMIRRRRPSE